MTVEQMRAHLRSLGLRKTYRPYQETETGAVLLTVRKPAQILDGRLVGSEIALSGKDTFKVWTPRKKKAAALAHAHAIRVRLLDGEAEMFVPANLADTILPQFGAKTKRELTPEQLAAARLRIQQVRNRPGLQKNPIKDAVPGMQGQGVAL